MVSLLSLIYLLIDLYIWLVIISVIVSWLVAFNVINTYNPLVGSVMRAIYQLTEPALRPIRNLLPNMGGIDISPVILIIALWFAQSLIRIEIASWLTGRPLG